MSHLVTCNSEIRDIPTLIQACGVLGWTVHEGGRVRYYSGPANHVDYRIEFNDNALSTYNIGLKRQASGAYEILIDNSIHGPERVDGTLDGKTPKILQDLGQEYRVMTIMNTAIKQGDRVARAATDEQGNRWLEIEVG